MTMGLAGGLQVHVEFGHVPFFTMLHCCTALLHSICVGVIPSPRLSRLCKRTPSGQCEEWIAPGPCRWAPGSAHRAHDRLDRGLPGGLKRGWRRHGQKSTCSAMAFALQPHATRALFLARDVNFAFAARSTIARCSAFGCFTTPDATNTIVPRVGLAPYGNRQCCRFCADWQTILDMEAGI
jgi:hypothetical protein